MGILLSPAIGRGVAFAIIGVPLALFLYLGFTASSGDSGSGGGGYGGYPYPQSLPQYTQSQPSYPQPTSTPVPTSSDSGFAVPNAATDTATDALGASDSATATDSATDSATASATDSATDSSTAATSSATSSAPAFGASTVAAVVVTAYADLNRHDYRDAYNLGLGRSGGEGYQAFAEGYATTASDTVTVTGVDGDVVSISLVAVRIDGTRHTYTGTYTVTGGAITGADIQQVS